ncbi:MAG: hypothetical protein HY315_07905 [Acidobacteria bacterium]|nr:hypothetical protein [Acidobacteriota bacterium]
MARTVHAVEYDPIHDEIVVPNQFAQAILTFRGSANGGEAPIRVIQGSRTQMRGSSGLLLDPVNGEIYIGGLVFPREAQGDVAPIRTSPGGVDAVAPTHNLLIASQFSDERTRSGPSRLLIYDRLAERGAKPLRVIGGPRTMLDTDIKEIRVYGDWLVVGHDGVQGTTPSGRSFVGVWSIYDEGDVPPRWTVGGPGGMLIKPRGMDLDPKHQTIIVSDKELNAVLTYHLPEMFRQSDGPPTGKASRSDFGALIPSADRGSFAGDFQTFWRHLSGWLLAP